MAAVGRGRLAAIVGAALAGLLIVIAVGSNTGPRPVVGEAGLLRTEDVDDVTTTTEDEDEPSRAGAWSRPLMVVWDSSPGAAVRRPTSTTRSSRPRRRPRSTSSTVSSTREFDDEFDIEFDDFEFDDEFDDDDRRAGPSCPAGSPSSPPPAGPASPCRRGRRRRRTTTTRTTTTTTTTTTVAATTTATTTSPRRTTTPTTTPTTAATTTVPPSGRRCRRACRWRAPMGSAVGTPGRRPGGRPRRQRLVHQPERRWARGPPGCGRPGRRQVRALRPGPGRPGRGSGSPAQRRRVPHG